MTLDEIIAGMEHRRVFELDLSIQIGACSYDCPKCRLIAFRAEMEEMVEEFRDETNAGGTLGDEATFQYCADKLRAKIGEGK